MSSDHDFEAKNIGPKQIQLVSLSTEHTLQWNFRYNYGENQKEIGRNR